MANSEDAICKEFFAIFGDGGEEKLGDIGDIGDIGDRLKAGRRKAVEGYKSGMEYQEAPTRTPPAENTLKRDKAAQKKWDRFCLEQGFDSGFPTTVSILASYLRDMFDKNSSLGTIKIHRSWVSKMHRNLEFNASEDQRISKILAGWSLGSRPMKQAAAFSISMITVAWGELSTMYRSLVTTALETGMRPSELTFIEWPDVKVHPDGRIIVIRESKTDQLKEGQTVSLLRNEEAGDFCSVRCLEQWRQEGGGEGRVFPISKSSIHLLSKRIAELSREDPKKYSGLSFRSGMVTEAAKAGVHFFAIMRQARHKIPDSTMGYMRFENEIEKKETLARLERDFQWARSPAIAEQIREAFKEDDEQ